MRHLTKALAVTAIAGLALTGCGRSDSDQTAATASAGASGAAAGFPANSVIGISLPQKTSENWVLAEQLFKDGLVAELDKVRLPYNLSAPSQALATLVLGELWPEVEAVVETVKGERARVAEKLTSLGVEVTPSQANFLWVKTPRPAGEVFEALRARSVLVRSFHEKGGRLAHQLRITIGAPEENDELLRCLGESL